MERGYILPAAFQIFGSIRALNCSDDGFPADLLVADPEDPHSLDYVVIGPSLVTIHSGKRVVDRAVHLQDQPERRTVEVHNESIDHMLAAELEAEQSTVSDYLPD